MAGAIKVKNKHQILVILDADILEDFKKAINMPIGEYFRQHQKEIVEESKKVEAPERLPIIAKGFGERQTTISEYDIKLFQQPQERIQNLKTLSREQQTRVAADIIQIQKEIRSVRK